MRTYTANRSPHQLSSREHHGANADQEKILLTQPFPRWINRWGLLVFLICILLPAIPLAFIRQPVYMEVPFRVAEGDGELTIVVEVDKQVADLNATGEKVVVAIDLPGQNGKEERWPGFVQTVVPDQQQYRMKIHSGLGILRMKQHRRSDAGTIAGTVLLKKKELSVIHKIFTD